MYSKSSNVEKEGEEGGGGGETIYLSSIEMHISISSNTALMPSKDPDTALMDGVWNPEITEIEENCKDSVLLAIYSAL